MQRVARKDFLEAEAAEQRLGEKKRRGRVPQAEGPARAEAQRQERASCFWGTK